jgi:hypothetical protein
VLSAILGEYGSGTEVSGGLTCLVAKQSSISGAFGSEQWATGTGPAGRNGDEERKRNHLALEKAEPYSCDSKVSGP